jgi:hypothetical protein
MIEALFTVPFLYHPDYITSFALRNDAGIVYYLLYIYFEAPGLSGIAKNEVWRVTDW